MAKYQKKPLTINVSGKSVDEFVNLSYEEINKMGERDLRAIASRLVSASNKRIRRLEKNNLADIAPSMHDIQNQFTLKGAKTRENVMHQILRMQQFMKRKTSTIKGFNEVKQKTYARIMGYEGKTPKKINPFSTNAQEKDFWKKYRTIMEDTRINADIGYTKLISEEIQKQLYNTKKRGKFSGKDIIDKLDDIINNALDKNPELKKQMVKDNTSRFFEVEDNDSEDLGGNN